MSALLTGWAVLVLLFWVGLGLDWPRRWPGGLRLPLGRRPQREARAGVLVVVPARDEADVLAETLPSLLRQADDWDRLVLVDDRSADGTGDLARQIIAEARLEERARVIEGSPPPPGWSGKLWALERGLSAALDDAAAVAPGWVLFTDADIRHPEGSVAALQVVAADESRDLVSVMARLRAQTVWERLLIPPFVYFFQLMYPFRRVRDDRSRVAAAAGGCVLVARDVLERAGGIEAFHDAVIDDITLARRVRAAGGRLWLGLCAGMDSVRGYDSLGGIVRMVARTAFDELRYSYLRLAGTLLGLFTLFAAPPVICVLAVVFDEPLAGLAAAGAWALQTWGLWPAVRHHRAPPRYALALPFASLVYAWMTTLSAWNHWRGRGPAWKGRQIGRGEPAE